VHPLIMTNAELRGLRWSLGLSVVDLAKALGVGERTPHAWERGERPISRPAAEKLQALVVYTDEAVAALAERKSIVTYADEETFRAAVNTEPWVLSASWHRAVAWRARERSGARVSYE
jgi:predicted transcriptional regulator